jgi:hypothetical protein
MCHMQIYPDLKPSIYICVHVDYDYNPKSTKNLFFCFYVQKRQKILEEIAGINILGLENQRRDGENLKTNQNSSKEVFFWGWGYGLFSMSNENFYLEGDYF